MRPLYSFLLLAILIACRAPYRDQAKAIGFPKQAAEKIHAALQSQEHSLCLRKGGIGVLFDHTFVVTRGNGNEVILPDNSKWIGRSRFFSQMVAVSGGQVIITDQVHAIELQKCLVISFNKNKIIFYDFPRQSGGAYERD